MLSFIEKSFCTFLALFLISGFSVNATIKYCDNLEPEYLNGNTVKCGFEFKNICSYVNWRKQLRYKLMNHSKTTYSFSHQYLHSIFMNYPQASEIVEIENIQYASDMCNSHFNTLFIITLKNGKRKLVDFGYFSDVRNFSVYSKFIKYDKRDYEAKRFEGYRPDITSKEFETNVENYDFFQQWLERVTNNEGVCNHALTTLSEYYYDILKLDRYEVIKYSYNTQFPDKYVFNEYNYEFLILLRIDESHKYEAKKYVKFNIVNKLSDEAIQYHIETGIEPCMRCDNACSHIKIEVFDKFNKNSKNAYVCKLSNRKFYSQIYNDVMFN